MDFESRKLLKILHVFGFPSNLVVYLCSLHNLDYSYSLQFLTIQGLHRPLSWCNSVRIFTTTGNVNSRVVKLVLGIFSFFHGDVCFLLRHYIYHNVSFQYVKLKHLYVSNYRFFHNKWYRSIIGKQNPCGNYISCLGN